MVGFELIVVALLAALSGGVITSIHGGEEEQRREIARRSPATHSSFIDQNRADEPNHGCGARSDAHDAVARLISAEALWHEHSRGWPHRRDADVRTILPATRFGAGVTS